MRVPEVRGPWFSLMPALGPFFFVVGVVALSVALLAALLKKKVRSCQRDIGGLTTESGRVVSKSSSNLA